MEMLFVMLVTFSNGSFESMEIVEVTRAETELGTAAKKDCRMRRRHRKTACSEAQ
jgi:hypothetical protein